MKEYSAHLQKQYADRACYRSARSCSRLRALPCGTPSVTMIIDGMDHSKFKYPRSPAIFSSKEMASFIRPNLDMTASIVHGHAVILALSEPFVPKDSNWCADLISHSLHSISSNLDLRGAEVIVQSDNTCREVKNNTCLRLLGSLTATHRVKRAELRNLVTGHSHEDVDQFFSVVSSHLEQSKLLETPQDFVQALQALLRNQAVRPNEPERKVIKVDQVRDWSLSCETFFSAGLFVTPGRRHFAKAELPARRLPQQPLSWRGRTGRSARVCLRQS